MGRRPAIFSQNASTEPAHRRLSFFNALLAAALAIVVVGILAGCGGSGVARRSSSPQPQASTIAPSAVDTSGPDVMTAAAYKRELTKDRDRLLRDLAWVARTGAAGKISDAAFSALSTDAEAASNWWMDVAPPVSLKSLNSRWNAAIGRAYNLAEPSSGVTRDLRGTRKPAQALLADLKAVEAPGGSSTSQIAADLQRGLWVKKAAAVPRNSFDTISFKALNKDAASLVGHRVVLRAQVFVIQDAGAGYYWPGYPHRLEPRIFMAVAMTHVGYGSWDNYVAVIYDGALKHIHKNSIVAIYGTYLGKHTYPSGEGYNETMPLIHAKVVTKQ